MDAAGQERLKAFFQNVILDPIEPDDPRCVDLWEGAGSLRLLVPLLDGEAAGAAEKEIAEIEGRLTAA